jgi:hypothetical protein
VPIIAGPIGFRQPATTAAGSGGTWSPAPTDPATWTPQAAAGASWLPNDISEAAWHTEHLTAINTEDYTHVTTDQMTTGAVVWTKA